MCKAYGTQYRCTVCSASSTVYYLPENAIACEHAKQVGPDAKMGDCGSVESVPREYPTPATCINCRSQGLAELTSIEANPPPSPTTLTSEDAIAFRRVIAIAEDSCKVPAKGAKVVDRAAQQATIASAKATLDRVVNSQHIDAYRAAYYAADAIPSHKATQPAACEAAAILARARATRSRTPRASSTPVIEAPVKATRSAAAREASPPVDDWRSYFHKARDDIAASCAALMAPSTKETQSAAPPTAAVPARATRSRTPRISSPPVVETTVRATRAAATRKAPAPAVATAAPAPRGRKRKSSDDISEAKRPAPGLRRSPRNAGS